jgi:HD-like signal output (HDOD) protein
MTQTQEQGFTLVSGLAAELSSGALKLPSLPEAVIRIRNALSRPEFTIDELARIITTEPALVGTILTMANSVAFKRSGNDTSDLKIAISRIGAGMVQTAATTYALRQLRESAEFKEVEHLLAPEWDRSGRTAAATYLIAQKLRQVKPDEALIVGLIHNIGRIYLYSRAPQYPALFAAQQDTEQLLASWHAGVAKAIVEFWNLPAAVAEAVERQDEIEAGETLGPMVSVLAAGIAIAALAAEPTPEETVSLAQRPDFRLLGLREELIIKITAERDAVRQELGLGMKQPG